MTTSVLDIVFDLERDLELRVIDDSSYNVHASVTARVVDSNKSLVLRGVARGVWLVWAAPGGTC